MPQLQILQREPDKSAEIMRNAGNDVAESINKAQSLKLTGEYYKTLAKHAETEQQKFELDRMSKTMDFLTKISQTKDPPTKQMLIKAMHDGLYQGDSQTMMHDIADTHKDIQENYNALPGVQARQAQEQQMSQMQQDPDTMTDEQYHGAQGKHDLAQARLANAQADLVTKASSMAGGAQDGSTPGGYIPGDMNIGGMTFLNPAAEQAKARATALGSAQGTQEVDKKNIGEGVETYLTTLNKAFKEMGGQSNTAAGAKMKALGAGVAAPFTKDSSVAALDVQIKPLGLQVGAYINKGRPTDKDALVGEDVLPRKDLPSATNKILSKRLRGMFNIKDPSAIYNMAAQSSQIAAIDQKYFQAMKARGASDAEINSQLDEIHKTRGY